MNNIVCMLAFVTFTGVFAAENLPVNKECIGCLCEGASGCKIDYGCQGDVCGPFKITWGYWADGGKPTVNNESPESPQAFGHCGADAYCSALAVQGYMAKFEKDCNGDGVINCDDYALIHRHGGYGCVGTKLPDDAWTQRYQQCKNYLANKGK